MSPTVVHLAHYGGPYPGSFIPMLLAAARAVRDAGWGFDCVFDPIARGRQWLEGLAQEGIEPAFAAIDDRGALTSWIEGRVARARPAGDPARALLRLRRRRGRGGSRGPIRSGGLARAQLPAQRSAAGPAGRLQAPRALARGDDRLRQRRDSRCDPASRRARGSDPRRPQRDRHGEVPARRPAARAKAKERLGLPDSVRVLLHFAWNWTVKGGPLFSETLAELRTLGHEVVGLSVGGGEEARAAAADLGLEGVLRPVDQSDDPRPLYAAADAFVACSAGEGAPFAMLEALCCGVPVVATDTPGHRLAPRPPAALRLGALEAGGARPPDGGRPRAVGGGAGGGGRRGPPVGAREPQPRRVGERDHGDLPRALRPGGRLMDRAPALSHTSLDQPATRRQMWRSPSGFG